MRKARMMSERFTSLRSNEVEVSTPYLPASCAYFPMVSAIQRLHTSSTAVSSYKIPCRVTARNRLYIIGQGYSTYLNRRKLSVGNKFEQLGCTYS